MTGTDDSSGCQIRLEIDIQEEIIMTKTDKFVTGVCAVIFTTCAVKAILTLKNNKEEEINDEQ